MAPEVVPSWRDLVPKSAFLAKLHESPLPVHTRWYLLGAQNDDTVSVQSQLYKSALHASFEHQLFDSGHVDLLSERTLIRVVMDALELHSPQEVSRPVAPLAYGLAD